MREIAKITGYSISTVSRVLNNKGNFNEETVNKIRQAVESFNYKTKTIENILSGSSYTIGVFIPESDAFIGNNPTYSGELPNLKEEIEKYGNMILLATNSKRIADNTIASKIIDEKKIDAAVIVGPYVDGEISDRLIANKIPYIMTNGRDFLNEQNSIDYDNYGGAWEVMEYMFNLGHKNIGIICGPMDHLVNKNRLDACLDYSNRYGFNLKKSNIFFGPFAYENGFNSAKALLQNDNELSAIFAFNDIIAIGAINAIKEMGLKVPDDISVVGFDDIEMSQHVVPALTTVKRFKYDIYQLIARALNDLIQNRYIKNINITLKNELIIRDSCKSIK